MTSKTKRVFCGRYCSGHDDIGRVLGVWNMLVVAVMLVSWLAKALGL